MSASAVEIDEPQTASFMEIAGRQIPVNQEGYLIDFGDWNEEVARTMAQSDQLKLSDCHWIVINFLRDYFQEYGVPPSPRTVKNTIGDQISAWGCTNETLEQAFPLGGCKQACRLAGLPAYYCHAC